MTGWRSGAVMALAGMLWLASATAQALRDPTQPPQVIAPTSTGVAAPTVSGEPQLQSVLISTRADGRRIAVIDGLALRVGDTFRDAKVVKVTLTEVVLRRGKVDQVLVMGPVTTARPAAPKAEAGPPETSKSVIMPTLRDRSQ